MYKENLSAKKLDAIIKSFIDNKSKSKDVLRQYLKNEGFEENIVEEALCNVDINIFFKASAPSEQKTRKSILTRHQTRQGVTIRIFLLTVVIFYPRGNLS